MSTIYSNPAELRAAVRRGDFTGQTSGQCAGFVQANVVILPEEYADDFATFCERNSQACPLLERLPAGDSQSRIATGSDLRTDVPRYRVFHGGVADAMELNDLKHIWRGDFCTFLLGCSFTFETGLIAAGLPVRHIDERRNVPMFRTSRPCEPAGRFAGPLVVSMRPYRPEQIEAVVAVTSRYPKMHGAPIHIGDPAALGIADLRHPDFGEAATIRPEEVPVFWACGVTPQLALAAAQPEIAVTHSPGCMFVTDLRDQDFEISPAT